MEERTFPRERPGISIGREASQSLESMVHMAQREELTDRTLTEDSKLLTLSLSLCVSGLSGGFEVGRSFFDFLFSPSRKALSQPVQTLRGSGETGCDWRVNIVECTVQCDRCMDGTRALLGEY